MSFQTPVAPRLPCKMKLRWARIRTRRRLAGVENRGGIGPLQRKRMGEMNGNDEELVEHYGILCFFFGSHIFGRTLKWWMNNSRNALECLGYPMGTLFFRQRCLESRIGGKCIYCTATKLGTFTDMLGITKTTDGDMVCQASSRLSLPAKMGTRLVKIGHGVVGLLLEQRCAKGMLFAWHRWWIGAQALTSI